MGSVDIVLPSRDSARIARTFILTVQKNFLLILLILEIDTLDTIGDACEHLVGDGAEDVAEDGDGQVLSEDLHLIALLTWDIRHVDHRHIHADVTYILGTLRI